MCVFILTKTVTQKAPLYNTEERMHTHTHTRLIVKNMLLFFHIAQYPLSIFVFPHVSFLQLSSVLVSHDLVFFTPEENIQSFSKCCLIKFKCKDVQLASLDDSAVWCEDLSVFSCSCGRALKIKKCFYKIYCRILFFRKMQI